MFKISMFYNYNIFVIKYIIVMSHFLRLKLYFIKFIILNDLKMKLIT
jgi:hypothetical protein